MTLTTDAPDTGAQDGKLPPDPEAAKGNPALAAYTRAPDPNGDARPTGYDDNPNPAQAPASPGPSDSGEGVKADEEPAPQRAAHESPNEVRARIAKGIAERRRQEEGEGAPLSGTGEELYTPPFIKQAEDAAAAEREAEEAAQAQPDGGEKPAGEPKPYTLKVRGREIVAPNREALIEMADLTPDEAEGLSDARLMKLAQKELAAQSYLEEARDAAKSARQAARAPGDTPPAEHAANPDQTRAPQGEPTEPALDPYGDLVEKIQYGDPKEAAKALRDAITEYGNQAVEQALRTRETQDRLATVNSEIERDVRAFETATPWVQDEAVAGGFYQGPVVAEIRAELVRVGADPEEVKETVRDINAAMAVYTAVRASGFQLSTPSEVLTRAAERFSKSLAAPTSQPQQPASQPNPPASPRAELKRALPQQPTRTASPVTPPAPKGDAPQSRSAAIAKMKAARGQPVP